MLGRLSTFVAAMVAFDVCTVLLLLRAERRSLTRITRFICPAARGRGRRAVAAALRQRLESGDGAGHRRCPVRWRAGSACCPSPAA